MYHFLYLFFQRKLHEYILLSETDTNTNTNTIALLDVNKMTEKRDKRRSVYDKRDEIRPACSTSQVVVVIPEYNP